MKKTQNEVQSTIDDILSNNCIKMSKLWITKLKIFLKNSKLLVKGQNYDLLNWYYDWKSLINR